MSINSSYPNMSNLTALYQSIQREAFVGACLALISLCSLIGNCLVIMAVVTTRKLQTVTNQYVVSLAAADLLVSLLVLPISVLIQVYGRWPFSPGICKAWLLLDILLCTASILNLCCISLDRYLAITRPLIYATRRSKTLARAMITAVWLLSALITLPSIVDWSHKTWGEDGECSISQDAGYRIYSSLGSFFVPFVVMLFVYCKIFWVARQRAIQLSCQLPLVMQRERRGAICENQNASLFPNDSAICSKLVVSERRLSTVSFIGFNEAASTTATAPTTTTITTTTALSERMCELSLSPVERRSRFARCLSSYENGIAQSLDLADHNENSGATTAGKRTRSNSNTFFFSKSSSQRRESTVGSALVSADAYMKKPAQTSALQQLLYDSRVLASITAIPASCVRYSQATREVRFLEQEERKEKERAALRREHKTAKTLGIVVGCFSVCWLPFFTVYLLEPFVQFDGHVFTAVTWLGYVNSVFNPFIYAFYNKEYASAFSRLICGKGKCCRRSTTGGAAPGL